MKLRRAKSWPVFMGRCRRVLADVIAACGELVLHFELKAKHPRSKTEIVDHKNESAASCTSRISKDRRARVRLGLALPARSSFSAKAGATELLFTSEPIHPARAREYTLSLELVSGELKPRRHHQKCKGSFVSCHRSEPSLSVCSQRGRRVWW